MLGKVIMVQGTASHVGKSVLVSALCRIFRQEGFKVAPFKAQNMSNNSFVTLDGGEIGRAQAVQAEACGIDATVQMNPVLLKPEADHRSQVVVLGKPLLTAEARDYYDLKPTLWKSITQSIDELRELFDVVVIEGAGSPAEINLKKNEIVNMSVAKYCQAPVLLCGDIDRGGVFASLIGTLEILEPEERELIKGFIINKFRGDISLLTDGLDWLEDKTQKQVAGVVHHYRDIHIPEEDSVALDLPSHATQAEHITINVIQLPHISNFDDFDPLSRDPLINLQFSETTESLSSTDLIIIPGSKSTISDLQWLEETGLADEITQLHQSKNIPIIGICGGYQMLGQQLLDPNLVESKLPEYSGLGLLNHTTTFASTKSTHRITGKVASSHGLLKYATNSQISGYEIHMGTSVHESFSPFILETRKDVPDFKPSPDGIESIDGLVFGTYIHGLFHNTAIRQSIVKFISESKGIMVANNDYEYSMDNEYNKLADWVRNSLDMDLLYKITGLETQINFRD